MKQLCLVVTAGAALLVPLLSKNEKSQFAGRWDMTITAPNATYPGWMEFVDAGGTPQVRVQPRSGSVRPATNVKVNGSHLTLTVTPAGDDRPEVTWDLTVKGDQLSGTQKRGGAESGRVAGVRAPELKHAMPKAWATPEPLFNGRDLTGWEPFGSAANHWAARNGELVNEEKGANLRTTRKFDDFKLHVEYNCPDDGNSGLYLRGRYEVQIEYVPEGHEDNLHTLGAIYGFLGPDKKLPRKVGQWESFDITFVGRNVTIARNGVVTINNQEIPGITGGALDSNEGEPGPFYIQGDHTGGMKFRNMTISVPKQ